MRVVLVRRPNVAPGPSWFPASVVDSPAAREPAPHQVCPAVQRTHTSNVKAWGSITSDPYRVPRRVVCVLSPEVIGSAFCCDRVTAFEPSGKLSPPNETEADCEPIAWYPVYGAPPVGRCTICGNESSLYGTNTDGPSASTVAS